MLETLQYKPVGGVCRLCLQDRLLRNSHVVPHSYFRSLMRRSSGKAIVLDELPHSDVRVASGQWVESLLCDSCEVIIADYESFSIELLRNSARPSEGRSGISLAVEKPAAFSLFFTSIFWRASVATIPEFQKVLLPHELRDEARRALLTGSPLPYRQLTCKLRVLADRSGGFNHDELRQLLTTPIPRVLRNPYSFVFVFDCLLVEFFCPGLTGKTGWSLGIVNGKNRIFVPAIDIFDVPELVKLMAISYRKNLHGKITPSVKKMLRR